MKGQLEKEGKYEIFETTKGTQILALQGNYYAIIEGNQGHMLVKAKKDHEKKKTIQKGNFYLADFRNNPEFNDIPHLFLQDGKKYKEFLLPRNLPNDDDKRKKVVITKFKVTEKKVKDQVKTNSKKPALKKSTSKAAAQNATSKGGASESKTNKITTKSTSPKTAKNRAPVKNNLNSKTRQELYEMAKKKDISNRSKMTKEELIKKLR